MADVQIQDVVKTYEGDVTAVRGISLHIADGEFLVLVGPSGCGKSTTLRMVAGLEDITDGTVSIGGRVVNHVAPKDRDIAMVFQNYALYPHMTVYKNMAFGLKLRKFPKAEIDKRVRDAAGILGITELLERRPKALSGGQRQRVALGRAIVRDPSVFLFDEPLSNLDAKLRVETRAELKRLHKRLSTTTIYVTHDQEEAMTLGDRVTVMSGGHIQQCDTPLNVYRQPLNRFVASFLGTPPMNFLEGQVVLDDGVPVFQGTSERGTGGRIVLDGHHGEVAKRHVGQDLVLGIRPEGLELHATPEANREDMSIDGELDVVEPLGNMMDMFVSVGGFVLPGPNKRMVARVKAEVIDEGTPVKLYLDADKMHLFETGEYGANLTLQGAAAGIPA